MASFFQRIFSRVYIVVQRQDENENQDQKPALEESADENASSGDTENSVENEGKTDCSVKSRSVKKNAEQKDHTSLKISDSKTLEIDLINLYADLKSSNSLDIRCKSALSLALCLAYDSPDIEVTDCLGALTYLCDSYNFPELAVCHALLLCAFTRASMLSLQELEMLEERIVSLTVSLKRRSNGNEPKTFTTSVLVENHKEITFPLCQKLFCESYLDLWGIDIYTICCCSLYNLSTLVQKHDNELEAKYVYKNSTIKYIFGMIGNSTQEIVSEFMRSPKNSCPSISSHRVKLCLYVLENALFANPELSSESVQHESFSLPHCLTRLLGWSVSSVFPEKDGDSTDTESVNFKFHLSTLLSILKILSILTFNPHQYDSFTNVKGLMEKILICTLKAYFESDSNHFDIQMLCLEMLINLYIKNQKTFILLCLKKFKISESEEVFAVEALIKMLSDNLEKIKEVKESTPYPQNKPENKSVEAPQQTLSNDNDASKEDSNRNGIKDTTEDSSNKNMELKNKKISDGNASDTNNIKNSGKETGSPKKDSSEKPDKETIVDSDPVLLAASKDMELSTIVSFISVLMVFFMQTKKNFKEFILSKLTSEALREATDVSKKFLEFASITGGMPVTGILILNETINRLQAMQSA